MCAQMDQWNDAETAHCKRRSDQAEIAEIWFQSGCPEGFSLEWAMDRAPLNAPAYMEEN